MPRAENILLITADQWRGDCLSSMGHPVVKTPNLDNLAASSAVFQNHYTNAVPCGPSRACLHTGMYLHNHRSGTNGTPLDRRFTNWALLARQAGYDPALFGYTHTAMDPRGVPEDHPALGSDEGLLPGINPIIDMGTHCPDWRQFLKGRGYDLPPLDGATYGVKDTRRSSAAYPVPLAFKRDETDTHFLVDQTMDFISRQTKHWCVHLSLRAPHPPWVAAEPYNRMYDPASLPPPVRHDSVEQEQMLHPWLASHLESGRNRSHEDEIRHRKLQAGYYGLMNEVDDNMGQIGRAHV